MKEAEPIGTNFLVNTMLRFEEVLGRLIERIQVLEQLLTENSEQMAAVRQHNQTVESQLTLLAQEVVSLREQIAEIELTMTDNYFN